MLGDSIFVKVKNLRLPEVSPVALSGMVGHSSFGNTRVIDFKVYSHREITGEQCNPATRMRKGLNIDIRGY